MATDPDSLSRSTIIPDTDFLKSVTSLRNASPLLEWLHGLNGNTKTIRKGFEYRSSVWVYACLNVWSQVSQIPLLLKSESDQGDIDVERGPVFDLLKTPFPGMNTQDFLELILLHLGIYGQAFMLREDGTKTRNTLPRFLEIINPSIFTVENDDIDAEGRAFRRTLHLENNRKRKIPVEGFIQIKLANPYDKNNGLSPISAARLTVDADYAARMHNKFQMSNRGRIEGVVTYKDGVVGTLNQLEQYKRQFNELYAGAENAGKYAHTTGIDDIKQLSQSMKDMDWLEGQKISREEICAIYGIPPNIVGILDRATFSNYEQAARSLWTEQLVPLGNRIAAKLQSELVDPHQRNPVATLCFDFQNSVPALAENTTEKIEQYTKLVNEGRLTPEVAADIVGIDIGEIQPIHQTVLIPFSMTPANDALQDSDPDVSEEESEERLINEIVSRVSEQLISHSKAEELKKTVEEDLKTRAADRERLRTNLWRAHIAQRTPFERKMASLLKSFFFDQRKDVLKETDVWIGENLKSVDKSAPKVIDKSILGDFVGRVFNLKDWNKKIKKKFKSLLDDVLRIASSQLLEEIGRPLDDFNEGLIATFRDQQDVLLTKVNDTTSERLLAVQKDLEAAILAGTSQEDLAEMMKSSMKHIFNVRESDRTRIARTEINRAFSGGRFEQMKASGVTMHEWLSSRDSAVRESHISVDGEKVVVGEPFSNGLQYPLDPSGSAEETVHCRCVAVAVLE
jgi:HK97 family phage portal protein